MSPDSRTVPDWGWVAVEAGLEVVRGGRERIREMEGVYSEPKTMRVKEIIKDEKNRWGRITLRRRAIEIPQ